MKESGQSREKSLVQTGTVRKREIFGHAVAGFGQNLIFGLWSTYMLVFYTDIFGISAGSASIIMLLTRVWDGINDPMMGAVADRTRTRWGRYRPWLLFMSPIIPIILVLSFSSPELSPTGKIIYAGITYVTMSMVFTAVDVPYWTMPAAMSRNVQERTSIISYSRMATTLGMTVLGIIAVPLIKLFGQGDMKKGYFLTAVTIGIVGVIFYLIGFALIREHVGSNSTEKITLRESVQAIVENKPLALLLISGLLGTTGIMLKQGLLIYYVQYCIGDFDLVPIFSVLFLPGMLIGVGIAPLFARKLDQKSIFIGAKIVGVVLDIVFFVVGFSNIGLAMIMYSICSIPLGVSTVASSTLLANTIEYAEWKFGKRQEGLISSTQTLSAKMGMALAAGIIGISLKIAKYVPNQVQADSTKIIIHGVFTLFCAVLGLIAIVPMLFNKLDDKRHAEIMKELEQRYKKVKEV